MGGFARRLLANGVALEDDQETLSEHFGEAPFVRLVTVRPADEVVTADSIVANPHADEEKAKGIKVAERLLAQGLNVILARRDLGGKGPGFVLGEAEAEVRVVSESRAEATLSVALAALCGGGNGSVPPPGPVGAVTAPCPRGRPGSDHDGDLA